MPQDTQNLSQDAASTQTASSTARPAPHDNEDLGLCDVYHLHGRPDSAGEVAYFMSVPWCRAHLKPAEGRPPGSAAPLEVRIVQPGSRRKGRPVPNADGSITSSTKTLDNAFSTTLHTLDTIGAFIVFYEEPRLLLAPSGSSVHPEYRAPILELKALMRLGPGLNGHMGVSHGGIVATILDEVLGLLIPLNRRRAKHNKRVGATAPPLPASADPAGPEAAAAASADVDKGFVTGYLNTTYVRPVRTPAPVLVTARYTRMEGTRKFYVEGAIWDDKSQVLAKADCVFIALKERL
ncbi:hypothetical protein SCUCBS95973_006150 [Sporothrix curviconia]|uniref:Thioesterase domain-containing protein n=1 Tax=Sporothrix curviconia TaxID=1260050 RepID=A0ABP0C4S8_9PEZI